MATAYGLGGPGIESRWGWELPHLSRPALRPTQPPVQWVPDYILITNLMHWLLFIHKIIFSSTCFEPRVLIFRRIKLYTCSIWYCHFLREFMVACRYTAWVRTDWRGKVVGGCLNIIILFSSKCFEPQVLIFSRIQLYTRSIWYCHSLWEFLVAFRYTAWVKTDWRGKVVGGCLKTLEGEGCWWVS